LLFVSQRVTVRWKHDPNGCITKSHGEITAGLVGMSSKALHVSDTSSASPPVIFNRLQYERDF
jgi:hypothetical protein